MTELPATGDPADLTRTMQVRLMADARLSRQLAAAYEARIQPSVTISEAGARVYQQVPGSPCLPPYTNTTTCNPNYLGQPSPAVNAGTYSAQSHILSLDFLYRF